MGSWQGGTCPVPLWSAILVYPWDACQPRADRAGPSFARTLHAIGHQQGWAVVRGGVVLIPNKRCNQCHCFLYADKSPLEGMGEPRRAARSRRDDAQQLPDTPPPHVSVQCSYHCPQL